MLPYLELMRPGNIVMSVVAVAVGALLAVGGDLTIFTDPFSHVWPALAVVFLVMGAGNAINDYVDRDADKVNKPRRPIPSGRLSPRAALWFSVMLFGAGILISGFLNYIAFFIAVINSALLVLYTTHLQNKILLGNVAIGYLVGSTFLFGGAALGDIYLAGLLFLLAMSSTVSREIVKDLEDLEGDKRSFLKRLASKARKAVGERFGVSKGEAEYRLAKSRAKLLASASMLVAILASPLPYALGVLGLSYLVLLVPTVAVFAYSIYSIVKAGTRKGFARCSKLIKLGMNLGLLAFVVGVLV